MGKVAILAFIPLGTFSSFRLVAHGDNNLLWQLDLIKIDRAFVSNLETGSAHGAIIRAIVALADALDIAVVAEGVETVMQRAHLVAFGSMQAQGNLFFKPLDPIAAAAVVAAARWQLAKTPPSVIALQRSA